MEVSGVSWSLLHVRNPGPAILILIHQELKIPNPGEGSRGCYGPLENITPTEDKLTYNKCSKVRVTGDSMQMNRTEIEKICNKPITEVPARDGTGGNCFMYIK